MGMYLSIFVLERSAKWKKCIPRAMGGHGTFKAITVEKHLVL